jgi:hypothetical protein
MSRSRICLVAALLLASLPASVEAKGTGLIFVSSEKDNAVAVLDGQSYSPSPRMAVRCG